MQNRLPEQFILHDLRGAQIGNTDDNVHNLYWKRSAGYWAVSTSSLVHCLFEVKMPKVSNWIVHWVSLKFQVTHCGCRECGCLLSIRYCGLPPAYTLLILGPFVCHFNQDDTYCLFQSVNCHYLLPIFLCLILITVHNMNIIISLVFQIPDCFLLFFDCLLVLTYCKKTNCLFYFAIKRSYYDH